MVDWIAHLLASWIGSKLSQLRFPKLRNRDIALVMLGAVLPDIIAINYLIAWLGVNTGGLLLPFHTPVGSVLVAATISLMFSKRKIAIHLMTIGIATHFALDSLLLHVSGGMVLLFPFNWTWGFQLNLISSDSWIPAIASVVVATLLLIVLKIKNLDKSTD